MGFVVSLVFEGGWQWEAVLRVQDGRRLGRCRISRYVGVCEEMYRLGWIGWFVGWEYWGWTRFVVEAVGLRLFPPLQMQFRLLIETDNGGLLQALLGWESISFPSHNHHQKERKTRYLRRVNRVLRLMNPLRP